MPFIHPKGSRSSNVWVLVEKPLADDELKGYLFSCASGYVFDKMMNEAGIKDYHVTCFRPDTDHLDSYANLIGELEQYKPPIIIPLGHCGQKLIPDMKPLRKGKREQDEYESEIQKYAGSLLVSPHLSYPHYVVPTLEPIDIIKQWKLRDIVISCDLSKAQVELEYWLKNGELNALPIRKPKIDFSCFDELLTVLSKFSSCSLISNDIETIYPRSPTKTQPSQFYKILPGYPITIGLASDVDFGISFNLFRESNVETRELWRVLAKLLWEVPSLGQNFFNFDANYYEALGFRLPLDKCRDTMIMHHILWPELPHKLQFLARQYTREPYWKDEGQGWSIKNMDRMKIYNCKDVMVTLEIYNKMLEEMKERGLE